ncbi:hypothetical protein LBMAG42_48920 [Deltaproteobacteria bacterium]|nr:hypothetical protein LBMAG42_48920 [Deltaproteobacteria bacterium]
MRIVRPSQGRRIYHTRANGVSAQKLQGAPIRIAQREAEEGIHGAFGEGHGVPSTNANPPPQ